MFNSDKDLNVYSGKHDSQEHYDTAGRKQENVYSRAQFGVVSIKKADEVDQPFPTKPVTHRRLPKTQSPPGLQDIKKTTSSTRHRGHLMPLDYHSDDIREAPGCFHSQKYSQEWPSKELQMARAIQVKELLLKEKLWSVGEKIRQTIQSGSPDTAAAYEQESGEERQYFGLDGPGEVHTRARISEHQRREEVKRREVMDGEHLHEDLMQLRIKRDQTKDRIRNKQDVQHARWGADEHETGRVQKESRLQKLNEPFSRKRRDEKDYGIWKETDERYREQKEASLGKATWTREKKYKERTQRNASGLDNKQNVSQRSLHRLATENQRSTGESRPNESTLPLISESVHRSGQQQAELTFTDAADGDSLQLLPCKFCGRKFQSERLEKHIQICARVNQKQRQVFNSSAQRYKGSQLEEYFKTHDRNQTPEVLHRKKRQNHKRNM
ncbi:zinc finger C2HC domain-containing protein 1C [Kryptolebias marmoratus]|uniref:zinc finger C2HC domain-containing protein 1C n=1 Tax=Kryptolebias marmoratus TaxID=37003 RepID=UPI0007F919F9|nr:zinc finger C2HC domain-containing protein 1C [Kryptolebias marmoratus]